MYRLYIDETGNADITNTHDENNRFFSLCGAIIGLDISSGDATSHLNVIKKEFFPHDPDTPLIFHRKDIMRKRGAYEVLRDPVVDAKFCKWLLRYLEVIPFKLITVVIDKRAMLRQSHWTEKDPYHYCMQIMIEKYVQWLERNSAKGDALAERRGAKEDALLEEVYMRVCKTGMNYVTPERIQRSLAATTLKMRHKKENVTGLQIVDLVANPSYRHVLSTLFNGVTITGVTKDVVGILERHKYDRSVYGKINGYGYKYLP